MLYIAIALLCLLGALGLMMLGVGYPMAAIVAPETLMVVHLVAIGWLSLLLCGALFQFVPVLVARRLHSTALPLPTLLCLVVGLSLLLGGFRQLAVPTGPPWSLLPWGGALLVLGFALALYNLGRTLWAARPLTWPARFVTIGLASLVVAALLGLIFTLIFGGASASPAFAALTAQGLPLHVIAGLGGWLTFTAMGVSYRLLAMFMLAPELNGASTRWAFLLGVAALAVALAGGTVAIWSGIAPGWALLAAALLALGAFGCYGDDIIRLYRQRKRRVIELNSRMAGVALVHLAAAVLLAIVLVATDMLGHHIGALLFLIAFGWLTGLGLAKLYKIVAFLTWLECYGPVLGKVITPRVQDLVIEPRAIRWFWVYFAAVDATVLALFAAAPAVARSGVAAMLVATGAIVAELVRIRRLADVPRETRLPTGTRQPRLLVSTVKDA
ncbi:hypothetical protein ACFO8O_02225 [Hephaestia sp. GCM10023244]|uniref:hypothetical protein n=1 Tax=unclassified Hephaestia TaxID=2631281 RepID=UPI00207747AD|nr:hypothetical protein [Hephaestia sp. MAHUQ-44]MCM8729789.1 hypothetical protein [Hephaestia sp. MAHUQ-44]